MELKSPEAGPAGDCDAGTQEAEKLQDLFDAVFYNNEIVKSICSSTGSVKDLLIFRLVSKTFHYEATVRMRIVPAQIDFNTDKTIASFLEFIKNSRLNLVSPFTAFKLKLSEPAEVIEEFSNLMGRTARHYVLNPGSSRSCKHKLTILLSRSPLIRSLQLPRDQFLFEEDLAVRPLPYFSALEVIEIKNGHHWSDKLPGTCSLLSALVEQPTPLKHINLPLLRTVDIPNSDLGLGGYPNLEILRLITLNHQQLPTVSMSGMGLEMEMTTKSKLQTFEIRPRNLHIFQELIRMNFAFKNLSIGLSYAAGEVEVSQTISDWLNSQSQSLVSFSVWLHNYDGSMLQYSFPLLKQLYLRLRLATESSHEFLQFTPDQFPVLRELGLKADGENCFEIFAQTRLLSLEKFTTYFCYGAGFTISWKTVLPNIRVLCVEKTSVEELAVILAHFTELTELQVRLSSDAKDYWDILTGGAPRPLDTEDLVNTATEIGNSNVEEPFQESDGSFQVPSLRNMKALKKFKCSYTYGSDCDSTKPHVLDPITYMTLAKQLVPLDELNIHVVFCKYEEITRNMYRNILAKFHKNVKIFAYYWSNVNPQIN